MKKDTHILAPKNLPTDILSSPVKARPRLYGNTVMRGKVTVLGGAGGVGKSMAQLMITVSLAIGRDEDFMGPLNIDIEVDLDVNVDIGAAAASGGKLGKQALKANKLKAKLRKVAKGATKGATVKKGATGEEEKKT